MEKFAFIKKAAKRTFILVLLSVLLVKINSCLMKFIESSTYTASKFVKQDQAEFPSMTICNENGYKNEVLNFHGIYQNKITWIVIQKIFPGQATIQLLLRWNYMIK